MKKESWVIRHIISIICLIFGVFFSMFFCALGFLMDYLIF
jgi:hypothetical protein